MKCFIRLWCVYFMVLCLLPCADRREVIHQHEVQFSVNSAEDCSDNCTPFCACNCCSVEVLSSNAFIPYQNFLRKFPQIYAITTNGIPKEIPFVAFQPPEAFDFA